MQTIQAISTKEVCTESKILEKKFHKLFILHSLTLTNVLFEKKSNQYLFIEF